MQYGLPYFTIVKRDYGFGLPCHLYQNGRCLIYSNSPHACRRYRCHLLKRLATGEINLQNGLLIVDHAKGLKDSIDKKIANFENSRNFRQKVNLFWICTAEIPLLLGYLETKSSKKSNLFMLYCINSSKRERFKAI